MHIEINPDFVEDPNSGLGQVYYSGMPVPQLFRFLPPVTGVSAVRYCVVETIEDRLAAMSVHERLRFAAAAGRVAASKIDRSSRRVRIPSLKRIGGDAD